MAKITFEENQNIEYKEAWREEYLKLSYMWLTDRNT